MKVLVRNMLSGKTLSCDWKWEKNPAAPLDFVNVAWAQAFVTEQWKKGLRLEVLKDYSGVLCCVRRETAFREISTGRLELNGRIPRCYRPHRPDTGPLPVKKEVLLIEDEASIQDLVGEILSRNGIQTKFASSATEGLKFIRNSPFGLVLLDLGLPDLEGEKTLEQIRSARIDQKVVILTGQTVDDEQALALRSQGALAVLQKAASIQQLAQTVEDFMA